MNAHNNFLQGIENNRGRFQQEQHGLTGQSLLGYIHLEQQRDTHNPPHTRTPYILGASPAELSVYPASRQDS